MNALHPIAFKGPLVRAILSGEKTQTRRLVDLANAAPRGTPVTAQSIKDRVRCPLGAPGDGLWVRERVRVLAVSRGPIARTVRLCYEADDAETEWLLYPARLAAPVEGQRIANGCYREAARLFLAVRSVRAERLQAITDADARAEGTGLARIQHAGATGRGPVVDGFANAWNALAPTWARWEDNPWVWVVGFELWEGGQETA